MSKVETNTIDTVSGSNTMQIGSTNTATINLGVSGDTINVPAGVTIANAGTATGFGDANTPAFSVQLGFNESQNVSEATNTKVQLDSEYFDTDNAFDASTNYRFTVPSGKAGKYFFTWSIYLYQPTVSNMRIVESMLYLNGSRYIGAVHNGRDVYFRTATKGNSAFLDLSVGDYVELYGFVDIYANNNETIVGSASKMTYFGAYKIIE